MHRRNQIPSNQPRRTFWRNCAQWALLTVLAFPLPSSELQAGPTVQLEYTGEIEGLQATATLGFEDLRTGVNPVGFFLAGGRPAWLRQNGIDGRIYLGAEVITSTAQYSLNGTVDGASDFGYADAVRTDAFERFIVRLDFAADANFVYLDGFALVPNPLDGGNSIYYFKLAGQPPENHPPTIDAIPDQNVAPQTELRVIVSGSDPDAGQALTYSLEPGAPDGASITPAGLFTWTPSQLQPPGVVLITVKLTDNGQPSRNVTRQIKVTVTPSRSVELSARLVPNTLQLSIKGGEVNDLFTVQSSADLNNWNPVTSLRKTGTADVSYDAPVVTTESRLFYRVIVEPN